MTAMPGSLSSDSAIVYSIVIPVYNSADVLPTLLGSIPRRDDIEVIVVDDHSEPDESAAMERLLAHGGFKHPRYLRNDGPKGPGGARNVGVDAAVGEWLVFADSDDYFLTEGFEHALDRYRDSGCDHVMFRQTTSTESQGVSRTLLGEQLFDRGDVLVYGFSTPVVWSRFFRSSLVKDNGIRFPNDRFGQDNMFSARAMAASQTPVLDSEAIYAVTIRAGSQINSRKSLEQILAQADIHVAKADFLRARISDKTLLHRVLPTKGRHLRWAWHWHGWRGFGTVWFHYAGHGLPLTHGGLRHALRRIAEAVKPARRKQEFLPFRST
jgi:glycosyltransferase involved in cell wall biosynthesis